MNYPCCGVCFTAVTLISGSHCCCICGDSRPCLVHRLEAWKLEPNSVAMFGKLKLGETCCRTRAPKDRKLKPFSFLGFAFPFPVRTKTFPREPNEPREKTVADDKDEIGGLSKIRKYIGQLTRLALPLRHSLNFSRDMCSGIVL